MAVSSVHTSPVVRFTPIPLSLLRFPPDSQPSTLPAPSGQATIAHPFAVSTNVYNALLSVEIPLMVALIYATTVTLLNRYNTSRNGKPWALSQTRAFQIFVISHNVFLTLFSAWTFVGLFNAIVVSLDGVATENGLVGVVDALCKINGPRGLGDAVTFDSSAGTWGFTNSAMKLALDSTPDSTDIGRIWNEGLAFYGWLFYLSKFYEVVDTFIILARGKQGSFLQMYHHAGAMLCMWAGIRYMAPPIWMFVLVNSFIHVLMYSYYTATAANVKVPKAVKQTITTLQILQMVVGATYALLHLCIAYTIPVSVPYIFSLADLTSKMPSDMSSVIASTATASATADLGSWLKKIAFRAAGKEGLAENVRNEAGEPFGIDAVHAAADLKAREEIRYRDELHLIHCTSTSGQVAAILINCFYLAPLTWLFVRFFIRSYTNNGGQAKGGRARKQSIGDASRTAVSDVKRKLGMTPETPGPEKSSASGKQKGAKSSVASDLKSKDFQDADVLATAEVVTDALDGGLEPAKRSGKE